MSDTTSPPSVHLHPLSPSSSMSSTGSAPQSEPTSDEQPDLGAFTSVLRAWTYLQPPPRIPVQIHSPTTSTTTTFQPDQSVVDSDFQSNSRTLPPSSSSFTRPPSSSVLQEESTVWNHAPIASYLYSGTPSIDREDDNSVASTEGGRTVEINSEFSFDGQSRSTPSQPPYPDVAIPVMLEPSSTLPQSGSSASLPSSNIVSYSSKHSLSSYRMPESSIPEESDHDLLLVPQRVISTEVSTAALKSQRSPNSNSMITPTFGPPPVQQQHQTVLIHQPPPSDDASVSHLSLPPPVGPPLPSIPTNLQSNQNSNSKPSSYLPQQPAPISLSKSQPPSLAITSTSSLARGLGGTGRATIVVDDLRTPDTPELVLVDWKRGGKTGGFRPIDDDREEEVGERRAHANGYGEFGFGRAQQIQGWGQNPKHISGYTSNYEGSQPSFRARKSRGRSTSLEAQIEDSEDSKFNSDIADHEDQDRDDEDEEEDIFPHYRRRRGKSQTHTPRYYGRTHTPPRGVLPTQPLQSMGQTQTQNSMEVSRGPTHVQPQSHTDSHKQFYSRRLDSHSYPDPYPRPHARPHVQDKDRDIYSSHSSQSPMSSLPSMSSSPRSHLAEPSPIQRDYVLIQPQPSVPQQTQSHPSPPQSQPQDKSHPVFYLSTSNQSSSIYPSTKTTATAVPAFPNSNSIFIPPSVPLSAVTIPSSVVPVPSSVVPVPPSSVAAAVSFPASSSSHSHLRSGQGAVTSEDHNDFPLLLLSNKHDPPPPPPIASSALLSKTIEKPLKPDKIGTAEKTDNAGSGNKSGEPDKLDKSEKASWGYVNMEEDEVVSVSISEGSSSLGGGGVGSGVGLGLGQPSHKLQQALPTKLQQPLMIQPCMKEQRRQLEFQQTNVRTRLHIESDSDGSEDGEGTTTVGAGASVLGSEIITITTTTAAPSTAISTTTTADPQPPNPNPVSNLISNQNPNQDLAPDSNLKNNPHTNNHSKQSYPNPRYNSRHRSQYSYGGYHSDSHVAHVEDTNESKLELEPNHDLDHDVRVSTGTVRRVGVGVSGVSGDGLVLPSLGYLDEALSFIAEERARWSAAREGGSGGGVEAGGSGGAGAGAAKGGGEGGRKTEDWKVLDHDMDIPKRKRRRKRPPRQHQALSNSNPEAPDEDGGGPSTSTSSAKKRRARSSSWSPAKNKNGGKGKEKEFLIAPQVSLGSTSFLPATVEGDQLATGDGVDLRSKEQGFGKKDEDGPTTGFGVIEDVFGPVNTGPGKRGKRMGKKERERERARKELLIGNDAEKTASRGRAVDETEHEEDHDNEGDNDDDGDDDDEDEDEDAESQGDLSVEDISLNNLSILQPPHGRRRKKGKDIVHIHSRAGIAGGGAYKSTPGSPKGRHDFDDISVDQEDGGHEDNHEFLDVEDNAGGGGGGGGVPDEILDGSTVKKRTLSKRRRGLVRVRSVPQMTLDAEGPTPYAPEETVTVIPAKIKAKKERSKASSSSSSSALAPGGVELLDSPQTKRSRLIALAKKLRDSFPEQRQELRKVTIRLEKHGMGSRGKGKKAFLTSHGVGVGGSPQSAAKSTVLGAKTSKPSLHRRAVSESTSVDINDDSIESKVAADRGDIPEVEEYDEEELDPRGRPPKKSDVLIHVFIDHSNILIGLLSYLKRFPSPHAESKGNKRGHPLPPISAKATPTVSMSHVTTSALAFAAVKPTSSRPLPNPNSPSSGSGKPPNSASSGSGKPPNSASSGSGKFPNSSSGNGKSSANSPSSSSIPIAVPGHHRIPLPSFATVSRSLPSGSVLNEYLVENDDGLQIEEKDVHSDGYEYQGEDEDVDDLRQINSLAKVWKPREKKSVKHLWHAALVLLLERGRSVTRRVIVTSSPLYQPMDGIERLGYELRVYVRVPDLGNGMDRERHGDRDSSLSRGSKIIQSSPANPVSFSGLPLPVKSKKPILGHVRHISGGTSAESGSGGGGSGNASGGTSNLHPYYGIANNTPPHGKVKYREQGVDELLQLKLHQALAATDAVPDGSTIVLATGDGNMGQFNEEGFLGPIRTALRRGWKVELYAWEDGLSRAWRREFGEGTEWGRKGMFRVIGMEQFASSLVEVID